MATFGKAAIPFAVAVVVCAAIGWHFYQSKREQRGPADVNAIRARAEAGDAKSQYTLGSLYLHGQGVPQDLNEALGWYRKAADQGDANGQYGVGYLYNYGYGVLRDIAEALRWYRKAADQGLAKAQYAIGTMYFNGEGVPKDDAEAARWFRRAAERGLPQAESALGNTEYYGHGVAQDRIDAYRLFRKAAEQGDESAQRALGMSGTGSSTWRIVDISLMAFGSLYLLMSVRSLESIIDDRQQRNTALAGLFGLAFAGLDYYGAAHIGKLHSIAAAMAFYLAVSILCGVYLAVIVIRAYPKIASIVLIVACALFVLSCVAEIPRYDAKGFPPPICAFCSANGMFIGIAAPIVVWMYLAGRRAVPSNTAITA